MSEKLMIKTISKKLIYEIQNEGVKISYGKWLRGIHTYYEYIVHFEDIGKELTYKRGKKFAFYIFLIFTILSIIGMIYSILGLDGFDGRGLFLYISSILMWSICAYFSYKDENLKTTYLKTRKNALYFIETEKNGEEVKKFIDLIYAKAKEYIKEKYGKIDMDLPYYFQLNNIEQLKANEIITEEEYKQMVAPVVRSLSEARLRTFYFANLQICV
ncbi:MAG: hypothetical protein EAZ08_14165 [Cytophagales bacterium]|nr:MAG: hypothetical protein EAZ08_14165 [Cytophagales bacterium]